MRGLLTPFTLRFYDAFVLGFSSRLIWRCPKHHLSDLYQRNITSRHLEVGVGTGYLLDHATFPTASPDLTLVDINQHCLDATANRLARFYPRKVAANILDPVPVTGEFDSVGLCYLLHCLPGGMRQKAVVFDNIRHLISKETRVFGATIVQGAAPRSPAARALMAFYNGRGIFSNTEDQFDQLQAELESRFKSVRVRLRGCVALFEASGPRKPLRKIKSGK